MNYWEVGHTITMLEKTIFLLLAVILSFLAGWYAAWHPQAFFSWTGGVGEYWQQKINHQDLCPPSLICQLRYPSPTP